MNTLERSIRDLTKELKRFNDNFPELIKEMSKLSVVKRVKEEKEEHFHRMREFPRVELEDF